MTVEQLLGIIWLIIGIVVAAAVIYLMRRRKIAPPSVWYWLIWVILGFLMFISGFISNNVDTMVVGAMLAFAAVSACLTSYVKSEHRIKRALEVIFILLSFGVVVYEYIITRSIILGVITSFIVVMIFTAFVASYLLPKIRSKSKPTKKRQLNV
jgi:uncharacterized membrane protein YoaK (UPF0700 family)